MDVTLCFAAKGALVLKLEALTVPGGELEGVRVEDSWPSGRINSRDTVLVTDISGSQQPATLRAGGGTRDDVFRIDVACAAVERTGQSARPRARAQELAAAVERLVALESAARPSLGIVKLRQLTIVEYDVREFIHDKGRECDVHFKVECKGRLSP